MERMQENKMGVAPLVPLILSMSIPAMFSMLVQSFYNIVDSYFVAKISENAFTAVSIAAPAQMLMISVAVGTGVGINSLVARRLGEQKQKDADRAATHGVLLALASWLVFAILGLCFSRLFFESTTDNTEIINLGSSYLSVVMIASFAVFIEMNLEKTLQATGNMIIPMISQLIGAVVNIALDPVFIFGLFGVPEMGVTGAAVATVIGQVCAMVFVGYASFFGNHKVNISFKGFQVKMKTIKDIYAVGLPAMIMQAIGSLLMVGLNAILIGFSETAVAVYGAYFRLQSFVFMPVFGLTQGIMPIMGYNYGAGNKKRLMSALKIGIVIAVAIMATGTAVFLLVPEPLLKIFEASPKMLEIGIPALRIISVCFVPAALGIMFSTVFQAVGLGSRSLWVSILRQLVVILPVAYLLAQIGLEYVWWAFPIAEVFSFLASLLFFWDMYKKRLEHLG